MKRGFTLIESLAVISILGILAALTIYVYTSAISRSRDARRKSDLTAVALAFQARYDAQFCSDPADLAHYPGRRIGALFDWKEITDLTINDPHPPDDDCGAFSEYLITIPINPHDPNNGLPYLFNLSVKDPGGFLIDGKHYRLTAKLEKTPNTSEQAGLERAERVWQTSFGGVLLPDDYNYIIGN